MSHVFIFNTTTQQQEISVNTYDVKNLEAAGAGDGYAPQSVAVNRNESQGPLVKHEFYQSNQNTLTATGPNGRKTYEGINPTLSPDFTDDLQIYIFRGFLVFSDGGKVLQKIDAK